VSQFWGSLQSVPEFNQISNSGFTYDNSGDATADTVTSYTWNGAGRLKAAGSTTYTYDGDGKRVMNSGGTYFWPGPGGDPVSDTPGSGAGNEYIFFAGRRIAWVDASGTPRFYWSDHLGTTRLVTDGSGNVCYDADYYPFQGERTPYVNTCTPAYKFAGMKFDAETGNYYTPNRYYPPNVGRWMSPDPTRGDAGNPQSMDLYTYVLNRPVTLVDPNGLAPLGCPPGMPPQYCFGGIPGMYGGGDEFDWLEAGFLPSADPCSQTWYANSHPECTTPTLPVPPPPTSGGGGGGSGCGGGSNPFSSCTTTRYPGRKPPGFFVDNLCQGTSFAKIAWGWSCNCPVQNGYGWCQDQESLASKECNSQPGQQYFSMHLLQTMYGMCCSKKGTTNPTPTAGRF